MNNTLFWPLLILVGLIAHLPALVSFFVKDDLILILSSQTAFSAILTHSWPGGFFRPTAEFIFAVQRTIFGLTPLPYHALSFALHAATTYLLYRFLRLLSDQRQKNRIAAMVFALHPLQTESVSWISGQMSLFAGFFTLLLLALSSSKSIVRGVALFLATAIGLGFYESFIFAPFLCLALLPYMPNIVKPPSKHFVIAIVLLSLLIATYLYWRFAVLGLLGGNYAVTFSITTPIINLCYYIYLLLGGSALGGRIFYYQPEQIFTTTYFSYVFTPLFIANTALICIVIFSCIHHRIHKSYASTYKDLLLPFIWLIIALLPALFLPERPRRLAYTSIPAFAIFIAMCFSVLYKKKWANTKIAHLFLLSYLFIMTATLYARNRDWQLAGEIEQTIPSLLMADQHCSSLVVDAPNLLGDALFLNQLSTREHIKQKTNKVVQVYSANSLPHHPPPAVPICYYQYAYGSFTSKNPTTEPQFIQGQNWALTPPALTSAPFLYTPSSYE